MKTLGKAQLAAASGGDGWLTYEMVELLVAGLLATGMIEENRWTCEPQQPPPEPVMNTILVAAGIDPDFDWTGWLDETVPDWPIDWPPIDWPPLPPLPPLPGEWPDWWQILNPDDSASY